MTQDIIETRGPFRVTGRTTIYENPWIRIVEDRVTKPDGQPGLFGIVEVGQGRGGVLFLPVDDAGNIYLVREYCYAVDRIDLEVAGGGIDQGEEPLAAARRELREEFGIVATEWVDLGPAAYITTFMRAQDQLYLARGFAPNTLRPEQGLEIVVLPLVEAVDMVMRGEIMTAASCCLILKAARYLGI